MTERNRDSGARTGGRWQYQLRVRLADALAEAARRGGGHPGLEPLRDVLRRHGAALQCQYDAFAGYCAEAEREGVENFPLYAWTRATIEDPAKRAKYLRSFAVRVGGEDVYDRETADALEADLRPLVGGPVVTSMARHDTDPANNPQPPKRYRSRPASSAGKRRLTRGRGRQAEDSAGSDR